MQTFARYARTWGPLGVSIFALAAAALAVAAVYARLPAQIGAPLPGDKTVLVPASGVEGFPVDVFCQDGATRVRGPETQPDSTALTYTLERLRDNRQELVVWRDSGRGAVHWYFDPATSQQVSEPAVVDDDAQACILKKAGR